MQVLKQKRMLETQREQLYNQQMNMEQTSFAVQNMQDNISQVRAMKAANKDLKGAFKSKELNIDNIEKMNDEMADMMVSTLYASLWSNMDPAANCGLYSLQMQLLSTQLHLQEAPPACPRAGGGGGGM